MKIYLNDGVFSAGAELRVTFVSLAHLYENMWWCVCPADAML